MSTGAGTLIVWNLVTTEELDSDPIWFLVGALVCGGSGLVFASCVLDHHSPGSTIVRRSVPTRRVVDGRHKKDHRTDAARDRGDQRVHADPSGCAPGRELIATVKAEDPQPQKQLPGRRSPD